MNTKENAKTKKGRPAGLSRSGCQGISYLERDFLVGILNRLVAEGAIGHWWAIQHLPEKAERKVHYHLRMEPPPSRAVDWQKISSLLVQEVPDDKPLRFVVDKRGVNDKYLDGLLYARHDSRYLAAKGLTKSFKDYGRDEFLTDDSDWLDSLFVECEDFEVEEKRLSKEDLCNLVESEEPPDDRTLLRLVLKNNFTKGDYDLFLMLRSMAFADRKRLALEQKQNEELNNER